MIILWLFLLLMSFCLCSVAWILFAVPFERTRNVDPPPFL